MQSRKRGTRSGERGAASSRLTPRSALPAPRSPQPLCLLGSRTIHPADYLPDSAALDDATLDLIDLAEREAVAGARLAVIESRIAQALEAAKAELRHARHRHLVSHPDLLPNDE